MSGDRKIRKHFAVELIDEMKRDLLEACANASATRTTPTGTAGWLEWVARQEAKLALLEDYRAEVLKRDGLETIAVAEGTA